MRRFRWPLVLALAFLVGPIVSLARGDADARGSWRTASRASAGLAPDPAETPEAVIQAYAARAFGWRGALAVHSWIAVKRPLEPAYTVHQVVGWYTFRGSPALVSRTDVPDRHWFGSRPELIVDLRGEAAEPLIDRIEAAVRAYPFADEYRLWPGPNSNTFTAFVGRRVPELGLALPSTAIGKDYLAGDGLVAAAPSGTGYQVSLYGLAGLLVAGREGLEVNLLGLVFGIDPLRPALKLPGVGRIGVSSAPAPAAAPQGDALGMGPMRRSGSQVAISGQR